MFSNVGFGAIEGDMFGALEGDDVMPLLGPGDFSVIQGLGYPADVGGAPAKAPAKRTVRKAAPKQSATGKFAEKFADTALATTADIVSARLKPKQAVGATIVNQGISTKKLILVVGGLAVGGGLLWFLLKPKTGEAKVA